MSGADPACALKEFQGEQANWWTKQKMAASLIRTVVLPPLLCACRESIWGFDSTSFSILDAMHSQLLGLAARQRPAFKFSREDGAPEAIVEADLLPAWRAAGMRANVIQRYSQTGFGIAALFGLSLTCLVVDLNSQPDHSRDIRSYLRRRRLATRDSEKYGGSRSVDLVLFVDHSPEF